MNKFQRKESKAVRKESKAVRKTMTYCSTRFELDSDYKSVRRKMRKTARLLMKTNQKAHKEALSKAVNDYIRQDLFNTICVAKAIEVKNE